MIDWPERQKNEEEKEDKIFLNGQIINRGRKKLWRLEKEYI